MNNDRNDINAETVEHSYDVAADEAVPDSEFGEYTGRVTVKKGKKGKSEQEQSAQSEAVGFFDDEPDNGEQPEAEEYLGRPDREEIRRRAQQNRKQAYEDLSDEEKEKRYNAALKRRKLSLILMGIAAVFVLVAGLAKSVRWLCCISYVVAIITLGISGGMGLWHYFRHPEEYTNMRPMLTPTMELIVMWMMVKQFIQYLNGAV